MALDPRFIPLFNLQQELVDKTTGLQLAGGTVWTWQDNNRNNPKPLYQLTGAPPNYTYTALPNPITLTNAGTFSDSANNDIVVYAFPYDLAGNPDNYFIQVFAAGAIPAPPAGTPQFTREAVPGVTGTTGANAIGPQSYSNVIADSQFGQVFFNPAAGLNVAYANGITQIEFAPGWFLKVTASGAGTVTLTRTAIAGSQMIATNPPYTLTVNPNGGANISQLMVFQRFDNNPNIFASTNPPGNSFVSTGILLAPSTATVNIFYAPQGTAINPPIFSGANALAVWQFESQTNPLPPGGNAATANTGFTDIQIVLPSTSVTQFSSVQVVALATNVNNLNLPFNQVPVNQQIATEAFYNNPLFAYKPIPSYLVGWDFPLNPAQILGDAVGIQGLGANTGFYAWDQTIVFQTVTNNVSVSRGADGGLLLTSHGAGQVALIQYLDQVTACKILSDRSSVHINASTTAAALSLSGNVTLWACTDNNLPHLPTTGISALSATGVPTMGNGTWTQVPNVYQNTSFTLFPASATNAESADISLNGWDLAGAVPVNTAKFFVIVVGFAPWANNDTISVNSIGLMPGDIATRPAPKTLSETLLDSQRYFFSTFPTNTAPRTNFGANTGYFQWMVVNTGRSNNFGYKYPTPMRTNPSLTFYNPLNASNDIRDLNTNNQVAAIADTNCTNREFYTQTANPGGTIADLLGAHITASALLGVVD